MMSTLVAKDPLRIRHDVEGSAMTMPAVEIVRDIRHLPSVFNRSHLGLNVSIGVAYALLVLLFEASEYLITPHLGSAAPKSDLALYYAATGVIVALEGAAFVAVMHRVREAWSLIVVWGMVAGVFEAAFRANAGFFAMLPPAPLPAVLLVASAAADAALVMTGLTLAVRMCGVRAESFVMGAAGGCLVHSVPLWIALKVVRPEGPWNWAPLLGWAVVRGVVTGSMIYGGVVVHLKRRRAGPAG